MSDKPILFQPPMIRALLDGRKTQTRRIIKPQPEGDVIHFGWSRETGASWTDQSFTSHRLPYWAGDRLWVREAWRAQEAFDGLSPVEIGAQFVEAHGGEPWCPVFYDADRRCDGSSVEIWQQSPPGRLRAAMHMPRWASRLTLIVTDVRVQRLQEISEADAIAEGMQNFGDDGQPEGCWWPEHDGLALAGATARGGYALLWDKINGRKPEARWEANPWIVALSFRVIKQNIDAIGDPSHER